MKKRATSPERLAVLLLYLFLATLVMAAAWNNNRPISGPRGEAFTITVQSVRKGLEMHYLHTGTEPSFRIWRSEETDLLLEPEMQGRTFRVFAELHKPAKGDDYYCIIEMVAEDGSLTYTWEDYAASQAERLPGRMIGLALIIAAGIAFIFWSSDVLFRH